eukprot:Tamp_40438.p2 GENE.Tamp_40438~~Tamp_40438.p2  ORF type:complete len:131 (+),score=7.48 Tamp_40438:47-394(+)
MRRPSGLCVDPRGYCFFSDTGNGAVRRVSRTGEVETTGDHACLHRACDLARSRSRSHASTRAHKHARTHALAQRTRRCIGLSQWTWRRAAAASMQAELCPAPPLILWSCHAQRSY